jgi:hypothetical protein
MLSPPFEPVFSAVSPAWIMNPLMFRWKVVPSYAPLAQRARKLNAVLGAVSQKISNFRSPMEV